ncbi:hypothetical protein ACMAUO_08805 [Gluconacetobacter sp. Hr-1-5]|uniref:oxidoreductase n=1 Tax=Gluconacetobacter sp. Hr-1-5 TaxID=3395370 RepID=UPI003B515656
MRRTIIAAGGLTRDSAERQPASGDADLIAFGRTFIANPDLVARPRHDESRSCLNVCVRTSEYSRKNNKPEHFHRTCVRWKCSSRSTATTARRSLAAMRGATRTTLSTTARHCAAWCLMRKKRNQ